MIAVFVLLYNSRQERIVKVTQPVIMFTILAAVWMGFLRCLVGLFPINIATCASGMWLEHIACSLVLTAIAVKVWRVHRILHSGMKKVSVSNLQVSLMIAGEISIVILVLTWVTVVYPFHVKDVTAYDEYGQPLIEKKCSQSGALFKPPIAVLYTIHTVILWAGIYFAFATRDVKSNIESAQRTTSGICKNYFLLLLHFSVLSFLMMLYLGTLAVEFGANRSPTTTHFIRLFIIAIAYWKIFQVFFGQLSYSLLSGYELNDNFDLSKRTVRVNNISCDVSVDIERSSVNSGVRAFPSDTSSISVRIDNLHPLSSDWRHAKASPMFTRPTR